MTADRPRPHDVSVRSRETDDLVLSPDFSGSPSPSGRSGRPESEPSSADTSTLSRFRPGDRISHFEIREEIGRGGMGVVYRALDERLEREVALKFLPAHLLADRTSKERFLREARAASALDHPNVATVHEIGETVRGEPFLVMSYYPGFTLEEQIRRGPLPVRWALECTAQIAEALDAAHERGLIHRDLKPSNVLVPEEGPIKLLDFGLARWMSDSDLTEPGRILGTVSYMSPEQIQGDELDGRSDLWALGVLLYEMLTGSRPFTARYEHALMYAIAHEEPDPIDRLRPGISGDVQALVARCLKKNPNERFGSARSFLADVRAVLSPENTPQVEPSRSPGPAGSRIDLPAGAPTSVLASLREGISLERMAVGAGLFVAGLLTWAALLGVFASDGPGSPGSPPPLLSGARIAILPLGTPGSGTSGTVAPEPVLEELAHTLTDLLTRIDPATDLDLEIVPAAEITGITRIVEARDRHGADYVVTLNLDRNRDPPRLVLNLVDANRVDQIRSDAVLLEEPGHQPGTRALAASLTGLLGLSLPHGGHRALTLEEGIDPAAWRYYSLGRRTLEQAGDVPNLEAATRLFEWALKSEPEFPEAHAALAETYAGLYERTGEAKFSRTARRHGARAVASDTPRPSLHVSRGLMALSRGAYREALLDFRLAATLDSTRSDAYRGMGRALEASGRFEPAEHALERAIALAPRDWRSYRDYGRFLVNRGRFAEAVDQFRRATELRPEYGPGYVNLGGALFYLGRLEEARAAFERALDLPGTISDGHRYVALSNLGTLYYYRGEFDRAIRANRDALRIDSTNHRIWANLAALYHRVPDHDPQAEDAYRRALEIARRAADVNPHDPELMVDLAEYRHALGADASARDLLDRALETGSENVRLLFLAGHLYEQMGERERAASLIEEALARGYPRWIYENEPELASLRAATSLRPR